MKQTDTLIIAVALRYLAQDEERHEKVRARAEELRWQILHDNATQQTQRVGCVDTISRSQAIKDVSEWATDILHPDRLVKEDAIHILESLPSAEQVTGKLKNPCDSLLTADSEACKEQKSKLDTIRRQDALAEFRDGRDVYDIMESIEELPSAETPTVLEKHQLSEETPTNTPTDLISRDDAIALVIKAIHGTDNEEIKEYLFDGLRKQMWSLPSAESTGAMDESIQEYIKDGYMQPIGEDLISRQAVIELIKNSYYNLAENMDDVWAMVHDVEQLQSAEVEDRLYIKIYADDEPSVMAEKLYQICGETQNGEVAEWLKEYFPSAPDSRQRGEWVDNHNGTFVCDQCGCKHSKSNFCPNCGADMRGGEDE